MKLEANATERWKKLYYDEVNLSSKLLKENISLNEQLNNKKGISIYNLELHQEIDLPLYNVTRVPGGWIYKSWNILKQDFNSDQLFIPYDKEFKK